MKNDFHRILEDTPIIAAIKDFDGLEKCFSCDEQDYFYSFWRYLQSSLIL